MGGEIVTSEQAATYFVFPYEPGDLEADSVELEWLRIHVTESRGKACVSYKWIDECVNNGRPLDIRSYLVKLCLAPQPSASLDGTNMDVDVKSETRSEPNAVAASSVRLSALNTLSDDDDSDLDELRTESEYAAMDED